MWNFRKPRHAHNHKPNVTYFTIILTAIAYETKYQNKRFIRRLARVCNNINARSANDEARLFFARGQLAADALKVSLNFRCVIIIILLLLCHLSYYAFVTVMHLFPGTHQKHTCERVWVDNIIKNATYRVCCLCQSSNKNGLLVTDFFLHFRLTFNKKL